MPHKALVVDDQKEIRRIVRLCLEAEHGCEVTEADSGLAAMRVLLERPVDVVVTDFDMPRMTGLELLGFIKSDARLAGLPVIMLSSHAGEVDRRRVLDLGALAFVPKPFDAVLLRPYAQKALKRSPI